MYPNVPKYTKMVYSHQCILVVNVPAIVSKCIFQMITNQVYLFG